MKKVLGITFGGLQRRAVSLVLIVLALTVAVFAAVSAYQNRMLSSIVAETRNEQQSAISQTSQETMQQTLEATLIRSTSLQAKVADNDFSEVVNNVYMLQAMAQGLFENRDNLPPEPFALPDPSKDGIPSAMVLFEAGVDYTRSDYLGVAAHLSVPMIAMHRISDKIDGLYIGLADGTDLCVDEKPRIKLNGNGEPIPFPVRQRPWYKGAAETGGVYFTGIIRDAFSNRLMITCSAPVTADGQFIGVVGIDIILESMGDFKSSGSGGSSFIVNDRGQVIISSDQTGLFAAGEPDTAADLRELGNEELSRFVDRALSETTDLALVTLDGRDYYMVGSPMPTVGWAVVTAVDKELTEQPERQLLGKYDKINTEASAQFRKGTARTGLTTVLMIVAMLILGSVAALFATRRMVRPIEEMTENITASGRTGQLFEMKDSYRTNDEIEVLAESFADLSRKTRRYIENITEITREKERVSTELHMANQIQSSMLPHIFPPYPERHEFDVYASMDPAKEVGGDFYDFFLIDEDHLCMVTADVSGKGVPAALFMMISKTILQSCAMLGQSPAEILNKTNEALCSNNQVDMFVTVWIGILEISTGKLTAANAGHEYPVLRRPGGRFELVRDKHGLVIGALDEVSYTEYELHLEPGAKLFLYTDGVPEATDADNRMFGTERMLEALNAAPDAAPEQILKNVRAAVDGFVRDAEQFDDLTMMCLEYRGKDVQTNEH